MLKEPQVDNKNQIIEYLKKENTAINHALLKIIVEWCRIYGTKRRHRDKELDSAVRNAIIIYGDRSYHE